ncbi:hypothetical protein E2562_031609 [Oryza meyeriana var. granulata]|uniref:Uncharacterized protein n=1 Tax=Oryza meyeriana var. granulata TaxID=110450 RepID=A0A6G1CLC2_9ORYZ|nr:hypothetical protein E2562_031609 [Oryza meyeriana var. granulata]
MAADIAPLLIAALCRRQQGQPLPPLPFAINDANVFAATVDPSALYDEYWSHAADDGSIYLFSPSPSAASHWKTATTAKSITTADGAYVGRRTTWVFLDGTDGVWTMEEFCTYHDNGSDLRLYRIHRRIPRRQPLPPLVQRQRQVGLEGQFSRMCSLR